METIKIKADTPSGYALINKSKFDANIHTLWSSAHAASKQAETETPKKETQRRTKAK